MPRAERHQLAEAYKSLLMAKDRTVRTAPNDSAPAPVPDSDLAPPQPLSSSERPGHLHHRHQSPNRPRPRPSESGSRHRSGNRDDNFDEPVARSAAMDLIPLSQVGLLGFLGT